MSAIVKQVFSEYPVLYGHFIDEDGSISTLPIEIKSDQLHQFARIFQDSYLLFKAENGETLFEVSDGLLVYVNEMAGLNRNNIRAALYDCGIRHIQ